MDMTIRQAGTLDVPALRRFEQGIIEAERAFDPTIRDGPILYYDIEGMLAADNVHFVVAQSGAATVGCGYARIEPAQHFLRHAVHGYLGGMYVDPAHRGHSVNRLIIAALGDWCRSRHVAELRLEVYGGNHSAVRAYEKAGFTPFMLEMRCALGGLTRAG